VTDPTASLRDFRILWLGQVVSALGTRVSGVAFPLLTLTLTGSATKAGAVGFAGTLPLLVLTLHAGALVDRYDRKRMMLACEAARAVALASVAAGVLWGFISFWQLMAVAVVDGAGFTLFEIAQRAALRQLVPVARLPQAAALNQGREYGALLLGMPIGGVLYGISRTIPFLADAVSYAASFISLLLIRRPLNDIRASDTGMRVRLRDEIGEGVLWLWRQPFLRTCSLLVIASDLTVNALYLVVVVLAKRHGASPQLIGAMLVFLGVGGVLGTVIAPYAIRRFPPQASIYATLITMTVLLPVIAVVRAPIALGVLYGSMFIAYPTWGAMISAYRAALVPDHLQGRVQSVATLLSLGAVPVALLAVGAALQHIGGTPTVLALFAIMVIATAYALISKHIRNVQPLADVAVVS
jgi:MFS family permease